MASLEVIQSHTPFTSPNVSTSDVTPWTCRYMYELPVPTRETFMPFKMKSLLMVTVLVIQYHAWFVVNRIVLVFAPDS